MTVRPPPFDVQQAVTEIRKYPMVLARMSEPRNPSGHANRASISGPPRLQRFNEKIFASQKRKSMSHANYHQ
jgi:hypothetical protein